MYAVYHTHHILIFLLILAGSERHTIAVLRYHKHSIRDIARNIGKHASTVSRELRRNSGSRVYDDDNAHRIARKRWSESHKKPRIANPLIGEYIHTTLIQGYSPQQIAK